MGINVFTGGRYIIMSGFFSLVRLERVRTVFHVSVFGWIVIVLNLFICFRCQAQHVRIDFVQEFEIEVTDMAIGPNGFVYLLQDNGTVTVVDTLVNKLSLNVSETDTRHALNRGSCIAIDPRGNIAIGDESSGYIYIFDGKGRFLRRFGPSDRSETRLSKPTGLAFDRYGRLFVADKTGTVFIYNDQGIFLRGQTDFDEPVDVSIDGQGNIYILDAKIPHIQVFNSNFDLITVVDPGDILGFELSDPSGLFVEPDGTVFVPDRKHCTVSILSIPVDAQSAPTFHAQFGIKGQGRGEFQNPRAVAAHSKGYVYVADGKNANVQIFSIAGRSEPTRTFSSPPLRTIPMGVEWIADVERTYSPDSQGLRSFTLDDEGNIYCLDADLSTVSIYTWAGSYVTHFGKEGSDAGRMKKPVGIVWTDRKFLYVVDSGNHRIQQWSDSGVFQRQFGKKGRGPLEFDTPCAIARDERDQFYIVDKNNERIQILSPEGDVRIIESLGGEPLRKPIDVAVGPKGDVFVVEEDKNIIRVAGRDGELLNIIDDKGLNRFSELVGVAVDSDEYLYILDAHTGIQVLDQSRQPVFSFGSFGEHIGQFRQPTQVHVGPGERLYVSDAALNRISIFRMTYRSTGAVSGSIGPVPSTGTVTLLRDGQPEAIDSVWHDGSFFVRDVPPGEYTVHIEASGFYQTESETVSVVPGQCIQTKRIELKANGSIAGVVVPPVQEVRVRLKKGHRFIATVQVNEEDGQFAFQDIRPGEYELEFQVQGYVSRDPLKKIVIASGVTLRDTTILKRPGSVMGTLTPLNVGAVVTVFRDSVEMARIAVRSDGTFEAGNLYPGHFSLLIQAQNYDDRKVDDVEIGEGFQLDVGGIELEPTKRTTNRALQLLEEGKQLHLNADFDKAQTVLLEAITTQEMADEDLAEAYLWLAYSYFPFPELTTQKEEALRRSIRLYPKIVLGERFAPEFRRDFEHLKEQIRREE